MTWIRMKETGGKRWHAVYTTYGLTYVTWCARFAPVNGSPVSTAPLKKCAGCASRMRHPYLVPDEIRRLADPGAILPPQVPKESTRQGKLFELERN